MKTRRNAREYTGLILATMTILTIVLVTSASELPTANLSIVVDCDKTESLALNQICFSDLNRIATCENRCGNRYDLPCSCDSQCIVYNNCCENITYDCPEVLEEGKQKYGHLLDASIICTKDNYLMIDSCPQSQNTFDGKEKTTEEQETNDQSLFRLLSNIPVTNIEDGITYMNSDTYFCFNNANASSVPWDISFQLDALQPPTDLKSLENSIIMDSVMYTPPARLGDLPRQCVHSAVSLCQDTEVARSQPELQTQCESLISYVRTAKKRYNLIYTNRFCLECSEPEINFAPHYRVRNERVGQLHFSVLISLQPQDKITLKAVHPNHLPAVLTWQTASCDLTKSPQIINTQLEESTSSTQDGLCDVGACETGYEKHSDGQCKKLHVLEIDLADDEFPLTASDKRKWPFFMECALRKHVNTEVARVLMPAREVFDKTLNKFLYLMNVALYEPRDDILEGIFKTHRTWTLQLVYVIKAFHQYRQTRAAVPPVGFGPMESMVKKPKTPSIASFNMLFLFNRDEFLNRGPRINNITTTICLKAPQDALGCWADPFFANEEKLISQLASSSCFSQLQDSNHLVGNQASGQTLTNQFSWKFWVVLSVGLVTALIL